MQTITVDTPDGAKAIPSPPIDAVGLTERAASFTKRSIKKQSKLDALYTIVTLIDLTTLEGADTPEKVRQLCSKALLPAPPLFCKAIAAQKPDFRPIPPVAAVCVYPTLVKTAVAALKDSRVQIASVATGFPSGHVPTKMKIEETKYAVECGADEIDMVISRGDFLRGEYQKVADEIALIKEACGNAHLKVILETGELGTYDRIRLASDLAIASGADFIKTSTGKIGEAATLPTTLVMLQSIRDHFVETGKRVGMKPAGGIKTAKQAIQYLVMLNETLGSDWIHPNLYRFGASSLLNDVLKQIYKQTTGQYFYDKAFSLD